MSSQEENLFFSLDRILKRIGIKLDEVPTQEQWSEFLRRINQTLYDFEQERYLLERSMELSSREMYDLNQKLETAQNIAHLGYWLHDPIEKKIWWSKETFKIFGLDPLGGPPTYEQFLNQVDHKDLSSLLKLIKAAISEGQDYETEFRIRNAKSNKLRWIYAKAHAFKKLETDTQYQLSGIVVDITERKNYETKVQKLNEELISSARKAGMAQIATSVLHNIGNVLNSVNISLNLLQETLSSNQIQYLVKAIELMNESLPREPTYLIDNPKGKLIPGYLSSLTENLAIDHNELNKEINNLAKNINHIKDIVAMQKDISGVVGMNEKILLDELVESAIKISCPSPEKHGITFIKKYVFDYYIHTDKSKLLQILVNLIRNASEAIQLKKPAEGGIIKVTIKKCKNELCAEIIIEDNGIGIQKDLLIKIFSMGFTTKETGHGFGLHSCALAATEMGGSLKVLSEGPGKGATFILKIPERKEERKVS